MNIDAIKSIVVAVATSFATLYRAKANDGKIDTLEYLTSGSQLAAAVPGIVNNAKDIPAEWADGGYDQQEVEAILAAVTATLPSDLSPYAQQVTAESLRWIAQTAQLYRAVDAAVDAARANN